MGEGGGGGCSDVLAACQKGPNELLHKLKKGVVLSYMEGGRGRGENEGWREAEWRGVEGEWRGCEGVWRGSEGGVEVCVWSVT